MERSGYKSESRGNLRIDVVDEERAISAISASRPEKENKEAFKTSKQSWLHGRTKVVDAGSERAKDGRSKRKIRRAWPERLMAARRSGTNSRTLSCGGDNDYGGSCSEGM